MKKFYEIEDTHININRPFSKYTVWCYSENFYVKTYNDIISLRATYDLSTYKEMKVVFFILNDNYLLVIEEYYNNIEYLCSLFKSNDYMLNYGIHNLYRLNDDLLKL